MDCHKFKASLSELQKLQASTERKKTKEKERRREEGRGIERETLLGSWCGQAAPFQGLKGRNHLCLPPFSVGQAAPGL